MVLQTIPAAVVVIGLILYTLLAGADFGAGVWQLSAGGGAHGRRIRDHAHHANAPVWEANHVWLILVITVLWTAYPSVFGAIFSTLAIPIFLAALGIILRGTSYALQNAANARQRRYIDLSFAAASIVTPYMLGTVIGAVASGRVPPGNALGAEVGSWTNATSILAGFLAVATGAFLAAVFLAADAQRLREPDLVESFRGRALLAGVVAGGLAVGGLFVVRADVPRLFDGLTSGWGLVPVVVSGVAGLVSMGLVVLRRFTAGPAERGPGGGRGHHRLGGRAAALSAADHGHHRGRGGQRHHDDRADRLVGGRCVGALPQPRAAVPAHPGRALRPDHAGPTARAAVRRSPGSGASTRRRPASVS